MEQRKIWFWVLSMCVVLVISFIARYFTEINFIFRNPQLTHLMTTNAANIKQLIFFLHDPDISQKEIEILKENREIIRTIKLISDNGVRVFYQFDIENKLAISCDLSLSTCGNYRIEYFNLTNGEEGRNYLFYKIWTDWRKNNLFPSEQVAQIIPRGLTDNPLSIDDAKHWERKYTVDILQGKEIMDGTIVGILPYIYLRAITDGIISKDDLHDQKKQLLDENREYTLAVNSRSFQKYFILDVAVQPYIDVDPLVLQETMRFLEDYPLFNLFGSEH